MILLSKGQRAWSGTPYPPPNHTVIQDKQCTGEHKKYMGLDIFNIDTEPNS